MNAFLVFVRCLSDDIPLSLHPDYASAEAAAQRAAEDPQAAMANLEIDWPHGEWCFVTIVEFANGRPVQSTTVECLN